MTTLDGSPSSALSGSLLRILPDKCKKVEKEDKKRPLEVRRTSLKSQERTSGNATLAITFLNYFKFFYHISLWDIREIRLFTFWKVHTKNICNSLCKSNSPLVLSLSLTSIVQARRKVNILKWMLIKVQLNKFKSRTRLRITMYGKLPVGTHPDEPIFIEQITRELVKRGKTLRRG